MNLYIQEAQLIQRRTNSKRSPLRHIIIILSKAKVREGILKTERSNLLQEILNKIKTQLLIRNHGGQEAER